MKNTQSNFQLATLLHFKRYIHFETFVVVFFICDIYFVFIKHKNTKYNLEI